MNLDRQLRPIVKDGRPLADLSSRTPRGKIYQSTVARYRRPRRTPRTDVVGVCFEDPAPDWLWRLAKDILEHTGFEPDLGLLLLTRAITWCEAGDPEDRSERLRSPVTNASRGRTHDERHIRELVAFLSKAERVPGYLPKRARPR